MDTALPQKFPFILDRNLAKANCTGNRVCTSCDTVLLGIRKNTQSCGALKKMESNLMGYSNGMPTRLTNNRD